MSHHFDSLLAYWEARAKAHPDASERARSADEVKALRLADAILHPAPAQPQQEAR